MKRKNKKIKNKVQRVEGISLSKLPQSLSKAYKNYKKQQEIDKIKKIKLQEREETKHIIQEKKELKIREEKI